MFGIFSLIIPSSEVLQSLLRVVPMDIQYLCIITQISPCYGLSTHLFLYYGD